MTREAKYAKIVERMNPQVIEAKKSWVRSGLKRDKEYYEYLKLRRSRYIL